MKRKTLEERYPSLDLGYEHVKDILIQQKETVRDYGTRAITLLAAATAIVGIGIPIGFTQSLDKVALFSSFTGRDIAIIPILIYVTIAMLAWRVYRFRAVKTMNEPEIIYRNFIKLKPIVFHHEILLHTIEAFRSNAEIIREKQDGLKVLLPFVITEAIVVILWIAFVSALNPVS